MQAEHEADDMKHVLRHHLPKGLFMPVDRRDLLDVLMMQDAVINQAKDIWFGSGAQNAAACGDA